MFRLLLRTTSDSPLFKAFNSVALGTTYCLSGQSYSVFARDNRWHLAAAGRHTQVEPGQQILPSSPAHARLYSNACLHFASHFYSPSTSLLPFSSFSPFTEIEPPEHSGQPYLHSPSLCFSLCPRLQYYFPVHPLRNLLILTIAPHFR